MRHSISKTLLSLALASSVFELGAMCSERTKSFGYPFFKQRPQVLNIPRRVSGELHHLFRPNLKYVNGSLSLTPEYTRSFDATGLGEYIFFNGSNTMRFGAANQPGVDVADREFLLGEGFEGLITTKPRIQNFIIQFAFRLGLDEWIPNVYFDVYSPMTWTKWDLNFEETVINPGTGQLLPGEVANVNQRVTAPFKNIIQAWNGQNTVLQVENTMNFARVNGGQTKFRLADIEFVVGYNAINTENIHFSANLRVIAPTGNDPSAEFLFEPIAGDGHHTALGGGINGHFTMYHPSKTESLGFYYFANFYHMFGIKQPRTFDLIVNGPGSRYLLFKEFDQATNLYNQSIARGPNVLTFPSKVKISLEAEAAFILNYKACNWTFDIGYNIWGRTRESIKLEPTEIVSTEVADGTQQNPSGVIATSEGVVFGVKGPTNVIDKDFPPPGFMGQAQAEFTASRSTIKGTNQEIDMDPLTMMPTHVFVRYEDLDIEGAEAPATSSHKIFAYIGYEKPTCDLSPFGGIGIEAEFSGRSNTALNQWGVWIKGGFYFD